jgi:hypothetical protein
LLIFDCDKVFNRIVTNVFRRKAEQNHNKNFILHATLFETSVKTLNLFKIVSLHIFGVYGHHQVLKFSSWENCYASLLLHGLIFASPCGGISYHWALLQLL